MIITDAVLESDPILTESICDKCGKCADACPLNAIDKNSTKDVTICGKTMTLAEVDYSMCAICKNGAKANRLYKGAKPDRLVALCTRTCVCHLEDAKLIENIFENQFRKREAWGFDAFGKSVKVNK